jgi:hypothetical protein
MPAKRSSRSKVPSFYCPFCEGRLWRSGSPKHHLFYMGASEIKQNLQISAKKAGLISTRGSYIDPNKWIEEFFCREHGTMWLLLCKDAKNILTSKLATQSDWQCSTGTFRPDLPNPSVSEFTQRMSRRADPRLRHLAD